MIKIEKRKIDVPLTLDESTEIRQRINQIQEEIIHLSKKAETLLQQLIKNVKQKEFEVVCETDHTGYKEYYNGHLIYEKATTPSKISQTTKEDTKHNSDQTSIDPNTYLKEPEEIDPDFEEETDLLGLPH